MTAKKTATKKTATKKLPAFGAIWNCLSKVNVNEHLEKKGDYDYLPWAIAWAIVMEHYPETTFKNHQNDNGYPCFYDPQGRGMVRVTVNVCGHEHTEDYMITNYSNRVIQDPDPSQVNNCLKRALVKCLAYFGLGSYLYNQLDMLELEDDKVAPSLVWAADEPVEHEPATREQIMTIQAHIAFSDEDNLEKKTCKWAACDKIEDISFDKAQELVEKYSENQD